MKIDVRLFARSRELVGARHLALDLPDDATPEEVFEVLCLRAPELAPMKAMMRCAVDQEYAEWDAPLRDGAEVAFIPPTAGG
jgi:molybdopterin synthase catalytic subunit